MHIGVGHQQLHVGDAMNMLQKAIELIKAAWLRAIQREPTELCTKLGHDTRDHSMNINMDNIGEVGTETNSEKGVR